MNLCFILYVYPLLLIGIIKTLAFIRTLFFFNDGVSVKAIVHSSNHRIIPTLNAYCVCGSIKTLNI